MAVRAEAAAQTESNILRATAQLWLENAIHEITLEKIAAQAGVTERTILRKFGSKEGVFEAAIRQDSDPAGIQSIKDETIAGDIPHIVASLMKEYELTGMAGIRTLALEQELPIAAKIIRKGRRSHRAWCERVFALFLPGKKHKQYDLYIGALYAATDIQKWKLLRQDLGYSAKDTATIFQFSIESLIQTIKK